MKHNITTFSSYSHVFCMTRALEYWWSISVPLKENIHDMLWGLPSCGKWKNCSKCGRWEVDNFQQTNIGSTFQNVWNAPQKALYFLVLHALKSLNFSQCSSIYIAYPKTWNYCKYLFTAIDFHTNLFYHQWQGNKQHHTLIGNWLISYEH